MRKLESLYQDLEKYKDFDRDDNTDKFLETTDKIILLQNPKSIKKLLQYFDDENEYGWVLESLKVGLDSYPDNVYAKAIIEEIPIMINRAPQWLLGLIYRILNHPPSLEQFRKNMHLIPQKEMLELLDLVAKESEHHRELCNDLKKELLQQSGK